MIYNLENTVEIGKPIIVYDANGMEIPFVIECNTETGLVRHLKANSNGEFMIDHEREEPMTCEVTYPAPLRVEPAPTEEVIGQEKS